MNKIIVEEETNERIDKYLGEKLKSSRSKYAAHLKEGKIKVNGNIIKNSYKLQLGDEIEIFNFEDKPLNATPQKLDINIVYEDDDIIVLNKNRGVVVHPAPGNKDKTLVNGLLYHTNLSKTGGKIRPGIVHRIDKDTSGLLVVAKTDDAHLKLTEMIKKREVSRLYIALVHGIIQNKEGKITAPIGRDENDKKKMAVTAKNSKQAITHFKVLKTLNNATLVECKLETGRTHQIRVHFEYIGYPIVNDPVYNNKIKPINDLGQMLHATKLEFNHPITGKKLHFEAPIPNEMQEIIDKFN